MFSLNLQPYDSTCLGLFLVAISATIVATNPTKHEKYKNILNIGNSLITDQALNYLTIGGSMLLMGLITLQTSFGFMEWSLFALLSIAGICITFFNYQLYSFVPWSSIAINVVMLLLYKPEPFIFAQVISIFAAIYILSSYILVNYSEKPLYWSSINKASSIIYYLLGYYKLKNDLILFPFFWSILALVFAGFNIFEFKRIMQNISKDYFDRRYLNLANGITIVSFISFALLIELQREFLSVAFSIQLLAVTWISSKLDLKELRFVITILGLVFGVMLIPQILILLKLIIYNVLNISISIDLQQIPIVQWPIFQLGIPAVCLGTASYILRKQKDDNLVYSLEMAVIGLITIAGYSIIRSMFHIHENIFLIKPNFIERGVITNILFIYGLTSLWIGRNYSRRSLILSGVIISVIAIFRVYYFDLILLNPLWSMEKVGALPIFNGLSLVYGLPVIWLFKLKKELQHIDKIKLAKYCYIFAIFLLFVLLTLSIRRMFTGTIINLEINSPDLQKNNIEIYTYSIMWLFLGVTLLFIGAIKKDSLLRQSSLVIMLLTVGKVFLYDISQLKGLFRVFSFLGLGVSLIGLSWFYARFIFNNSKSIDPKFKKNIN